MKFNFDSKTLRYQIPSGIILGLLCILITKFIHIPFITIKIPILICLIIFLDVLHLLGKINIDISNLCKREKSNRKIEKEKLIQIYFQEHFIFLSCFFISLFINRLIFNFLYK